MKNTTLVTVVNIAGSPVLYAVPEMNVRRTFNKGEVKKISLEEIRALSYQPGGMALLRDFLSVRDEDVLVDLGIKAEPEYSWTAAEVKELLQTGSLERLLDCLDYAPEGIIEMVKEYAVSLKINDMAKRDAIRKKTGLDINRAIEIQLEEEASQTAQSAAKSTSTGRRVATENKAESASKYKVVG